MTPPSARPPMKGLRARQGWTILAMYGLPGVGKTALAQEMWGRLSAAHTGSRVQVTWDRPLGAPFDRDAFARKLLAELGIGEDRLRTADEDVCLLLLAGALRGSRNLVLIDGLTEGLTGGDLESLLGAVTVTDSTIIVVSRAKPAEFDADQLFEVRPLSDEASREVLLTKLGAGTADRNPHELSDLVRYCEGIPQALHAVSARVRGGRPISDVVAALRDPAACLDELRVDGYDLGTELASAYSGLTGDQRRTLAAISILRSESVGAWAVSMITGIGVMRTEALLADLEDARLLTVLPTDAETRRGPRYRCRRLVSLALETRNAEACRDLRLSREGLDRDYRTRVEVIYKQWWDKEDDVLRYLQPFEGTAAMPTLDWLRLEHQDVLHAVRAARDIGLDRPCWSLGQLLTGLFPLISCDWPMWADFFDTAKAAVDRRGGPAPSDEARLAVGAIIQAQGLCCQFAGRLRDAEIALKDSRRRAGSMGTRDPDVEIRAYVHLGEILMERGRYASAQVAMRDANTIPDPRTLDEDQNWAKFISAVASRNLEPATWSNTDLLEDVRIELSHNADPTRHARMSLHIADALREIGRGREAEGEYRRARGIAEDAGDHFTAARADYSRVHLLLDWGMIEEAESLLGLVRPIYEATQDETWHRRFAFLEARVVFEKGDSPRALILIRHLYEQAVRAEDAWVRAHGALLYARVLIACRRAADAERVIGDLKQHLNDVKNQWVKAQALVILGEIHGRASVDFPRARAELKEALAIFRECGDVRGACEAYRRLAGVRPGLDPMRPRYRFKAWRLRRRGLRTLKPPAFEPDSRLLVPERPAQQSGPLERVPLPSMIRARIYDDAARYLYDVMLCHDDADVEGARIVKADLNAQGLSCWMTRDQIPVGASVTQRYEDGLRTSEHVMVLVTSNLRTQGWAGAVYGHFLQQSLNGQPDRRAIAVLYGSGAEANVPMLLRDRTPIAYGSNDYTSLVAELAARRAEG